MNAIAATYYVDSDSGRRPIVIEFSVPQPHPEGDFVCTLSVGEMRENVGGIDPVQCLSLAVARFRQTLEAEDVQLYASADDTRPLPTSMFLLAGGRAE